MIYTLQEVAEKLNKTDLATVFEIVTGKAGLTLWPCIKLLESVPVYKIKGIKYEIKRVKCNHPYVGGAETTYYLCTDKYGNELLSCGSSHVGNDYIRGVVGIDATDIGWDEPGYGHIRCGRPDGNEEFISGIVGIDATEIVWDRAGYGQIVSTVSQGPHEYILGRAVSIHKNDLLVTEAALRHYLESRGIAYTSPSQGNQASSEPTKETVEHFIRTRLAEGKSTDYIVVEVVETYGNIKNKFYGLCARLLYADKFAPSSSDATWRRRGMRAYQEAKKRGS